MAVGPSTISGLPAGALAGASVDVDNDKMAIDDVSAGVTKYITPKELVANSSSFLQSGTGAVANTAQARLRQTVSVLDFIPLTYHAGILAGTNSTDLGPYIQAAIDAMFSATGPTGGRGGFLWFPAGLYVYATALSVNTSNKGITFVGSGASEAGGTSAATVLKWTGGASITIDIGTDCRNVGFRDLDFENTGTATCFVRVGWTDWATFKDINIRPTVFPTTAAIILGVGSNRCEHAIFERVTIRGVATSGNIGIAADRAQNIRAWSLNLLNCRMTVGIAGSMDIVNAAFYASTFTTGSAETAACVDIFQGRDVGFNQCHFEPGFSGYAVDINSSGTDKRGIAFRGAYASGTTNCTYLINVNFSTADVSIQGFTTLQFANPYYLVRNQSCANISIKDASMNGTGADLISSKTNVRGQRNTVNGALVADFGSQRPLITDSGGTGAAYDVDLAAAAGQDCTVNLTSNNNYTIRNFTNTVSGQVIVVVQRGSGTATIDRSNSYLSGSANQAMAEKYTVALVKISTAFYQLGTMPANG